MRETAFKCKLIDFLMKEIVKPTSVIGLEVPFAGARRRGDVVVVNESDVVGIEIKTEVDKLESAGAQISDYLLTFDYAYLATVKAKVAEARRIIPASVGLIVFDRDEFKIGRQARFRKNQSRLYLADLISRQDLVRALRDSGLKGFTNSDVTTLRQELLKRVNLPTLRELARNSLRARYSTGFSAFMSERGNATLEDELKLLQGGDLQIS